MHCYSDALYKHDQDVQQAVKDVFMISTCTLLFLVYIDGISTELDSPCRLFADNCAIFCQVTSAEDCSLLQTDLSALQTCQLSLSGQKPGNSEWSSPNAKPSGLPTSERSCYLLPRWDSPWLAWVDSYQYLSVIINSKLKWGEHCHSVAVKATRVLNLLCRSIYETKERVYKALVRPHLEYCCPVWTPQT